MRLLQIGSKLAKSGSRLLTLEGGAPCCCDQPTPGGYIFAMDCYQSAFFGWEPGFPYPTEYVPAATIPVIAIPDTFRCDVNGTPCPLVWNQVIKYRGRCYKVVVLTGNISQLPVSPCGNGNIPPSLPLDFYTAFYPDPIPVVDPAEIQCGPTGCATADCIETIPGSCPCIYEPAPWRTCPGDTQMACYRGYRYMVASTTRARSQRLDVDGIGLTEFWTQAIDTYDIYGVGISPQDPCGVYLIKRYRRTDTRFAGTSSALGSYNRRILTIATRDFPATVDTVTTTSTGGTNDPITGIFEIGTTCAQMNAAVGPPCNPNPDNPGVGSTGYNQTTSTCNAFLQLRKLDVDVPRFVGDNIQCLPFTRSELEVNKSITILLGCNQPAPVIGDESFGGESASSIFARLVGGGF